MDEEIDIVVLNTPILETRKYRELEGLGQLVTDLVLTLVEEERNRIRIAKKEGIAIAKKKGVYEGGKKNTMLKLKVKIKWFMMKLFVC